MVCNQERLKLLWGNPGIKGKGLQACFVNHEERKNKTDRKISREEIYIQLTVPHLATLQYKKLQILLFWDSLKIDRNESSWVFITLVQHNNLARRKPSHLRLKSSKTTMPGNMYQVKYLNIKVLSQLEIKQQVKALFGHGIQHMRSTFF